METLITLATIALAFYLVVQVFSGLVALFVWYNNKRNK